MKLGIPYNVGNFSIRWGSCLLKDSDRRSEQVRNCEYRAPEAGSKLVPNAHRVINSYITESALELTTSSPCSLYSWICVLIPNRPSSTVRWYSNLPGMSCEHLWHSLTRLLVYHLHFHIPCALYFDYTSTLILEEKERLISRCIISRPQSGTDQTTEEILKSKFLNHFSPIHIRSLFRLTEG